MGKIRRYYYENLDTLIAFLATNPEGKIVILIGTDNATDTVLADLLLRVKQTSTALGYWLISKMSVGDLELKVAPKNDLPQGVNLSEYTGKATP